MGFFSKSSDEPDESVQVEQPQDDASLQPQPVVMPPNVDGVLPPGVSPQPAPPTNNFASQVSAPAAGMPADATAPVLDDPTANDAGDFIVADPPMPADGMSQQAAPAEPPVTSGQTAADTPAYEEIPAPVSYPAPAATEAVPAEPEAVTETTVEAPEAPVETVAETEAPVEYTPEVEAATESQPEQPVADAAPAGSSDDNSDLTSIKQQALTQLSAIAQHLDQSPEEKFHTTMMMLQATDDQSLIQTAYQAAQAITDEKTRAQALLDVVNEINYFNQKSS